MRRYDDGMTMVDSEELAEEDFGPQHAQEYTPEWEFDWTLYERFWRLLALEAAVASAAAGLWWLAA